MRICFNLGRKLTQDEYFFFLVIPLLPSCQVLRKSVLSLGFSFSLHSIVVKSFDNQEETLRQALSSITTVLLGNGFVLPYDHSDACTYIMADLL